MRKPETDLRIKIQEALKEKFPKSRSFKIHGNPFQEAGIPDLIVCVEGIFIGMEIKRGTKMPEAIQAAVGRSIVAAGGFFQTIYSPEQAIEFVEHCLAVF